MVARRATAIETGDRTGSDHLGGGTSIAAARTAFEDSLAGKSPHTAKSYATGLDRFFGFLAERSISADQPTVDLPADALERFSTWLVRRYGRTARGTRTTTYLAGARYRLTTQTIWVVVKR